MYYEYKKRAAESAPQYSAPRTPETAQGGEGATDGDSTEMHTALEAGQSTAQHRTGNRTDRTPGRTTPHSAISADALGTALVQDVKMRNRMLMGVFFLATVASVENMYKVVSTFTGDIVSNVALTGVFALSGIGFMLAGLKNKATIAIVASLVIFEALCNASSIFGGLYRWDSPNVQSNVFLNRVHTLVHFVPLKNVAQVIALFTAAAIAAVQFFAIREVRPAHRTHKK